MTTIETIIRDAYRACLLNRQVVTDGRGYSADEEVRRLAAELGYRVTLVPDARNLPADGTPVPIDISSAEITVVSDDSIAGAFRETRNARSLRVLHLAGVGGNVVGALRQELGMPPRDELLDRLADAIDAHNERVRAGA